MIDVIKHEYINKLKELDRTYDFADFDRANQRKFIKRLSGKRLRQQLKKIDEDDDFGITYSFDDRLNECPFCSSKAWLQHVTFENDSDTWYNPQCSECYCGLTRNYETKEEAIEDWNKRCAK